MSELGLLMTATRPPYTHLRPTSAFPPPLAIPISDSFVQHSPSPDLLGCPTGREVQLWYPVSRCPRLAHLVLQGGVPLKLEPFPGEGPHKGELAMNFGNTFHEIRSKEGSGGNVRYVHLGRMDDWFKWADGGLNLSASLYESEVETLVGPKVATVGKGRWRFDAAQLFGSNLPKTALVVQLLGNCDTQVDDEAAEAIRQCIEETNDRLDLRPGLRVDPVKRMLITVRPPEGSAGEGELCLSLTHKQTLRRWENVKIFGDWLDRLDWIWQVLFGTLVSTYSYFFRK